MPFLLECFSFRAGSANMMIPTIAMVRFSVGDSTWRIVITTDSHPSFKCEQLSEDTLGCPVWVPGQPRNHNIDAIARFALLTTPEDAPAVQGKRVLSYNVGNLANMTPGKVGH